MDAKRLMQHMPKYYRTIAEIIVLQKTIQSELEVIDLTSEDVLKQFFIYTATWSLPIWERIFGLPVGDETTNIQERRENLISKLRSYGTTTKEMIVRVGNAFTNGNIQIIEHNEKYLFEIIFTGVIGIPPNVDDFRQTIEIIKPAHLTYTVVFRYRTWGELLPYTWGELSPFTWDEIHQKAEIE
ncbi:putative phage tail protein [Fusobacterium ulcerans]|uniref:putative phage tail protein n=1 Tax=Fusobacterium ulcerans TaxID=861 RepID=UPI001D0B9964|nr:putative phage tail protein [Fusobacterium ulcerans]MCB8564941.1 YmfQ family protein [Fusobacterium ulcerans]MCB8649796.1 YmfQ family protein [Fusobacterium ulcerans]